MGLLDSHPDIACIGELFQHKGRLFGILCTTVPFVRCRLTEKSDSGSCGERVDHTGSYLDSVFVTLDTPVAGFKLMLDQARRFPMLLDYLKAHDFKIS